MRNNLFKILCVGVVSALFFSCKTQKIVTTTPPVPVNCGDMKPGFVADIKPILDLNCASTCHSEKNRAGGIDLSTYENVKNIATKSKFLGAIRHETGFDAMPRKAPKLADADILKIACWVSAGNLP